MNNKILKELVKTSNTPVNLTIDEFKKLACIEIDSIESAQFSIVDFNINEPSFEYMTDVYQTKYITNYKIIFPIENEDDLIIHVTNLKPINKALHDDELSTRINSIFTSTISAIKKALLENNINLIDSKSEPLESLCKQSIIDFKNKTKSDLVPFYKFIRYILIDQIKFNQLFQHDPEFHELLTNIRNWYQNQEYKDKALITLTSLYVQ